MRRFENKVAIVTGAGTGIGEAIAHKLAKEGAKVVANSLPYDPLDDVVASIKEYGGEATACCGDVAEEENALKCVESAIDHYGKLDILINNAGVFLAVAETQNYPLEAFDRTIRMNLRSAFLMTKYALPHLQKTRGNIVCAGSEAGFNGLAQNTPYGGTKGWMHSFVKGVAVEQAKYGVRVNCYCPGAIDTAWTHKETGPMDAQMEEMLINATPMARRGTPEEMANVCAFLASDE
ncbi:MAG: SDR family NAD(P)-dependent oxidoreductase, partial [Waterburya sp.]